MLFVGSENTIQRVDTESGAVLATDRHRNGIWTPSHDGKREYFAGVSGRFEVIDTRSRTVLKSYDLASHLQVRDVALASDESSAVVLANDGLLRIIDLASEIHREIPVNPDATRLALSPDGQRGIIGISPRRLDSPIIEVVDLANGDVSASLSNPQPGFPDVSRMAFDTTQGRAYVPSGETLLVFDLVEGGTARVLRLADDEIPIIADFPDALAISGDGEVVYVTTRRVGPVPDPRLYAIDAQSLTPIAMMRLTARSTAIVLEDERSLLYLADRDRCFVNVVDIDRWEHLNSLEVLDGPVHLVLRNMRKEEEPAIPAPSPPLHGDGTELCAWVTHLGGEIAVIDLGTDERLGFLHTEGSGGITFHPDATRAHIVVGAGGSIVAIDTANYQEASRSVLGATPMSLANSPDGELLLAGTIDARCHEVIALDGGDGSVRAGIGCGECSGDGRPSFTTLEVRFAPDGRRAYAQTHRNDAYVISVIDTSTLTIVDSIPLDAPAGGFDLSPDGSRLYVSLRPSTGASSVAEYDTTTLLRVGTISLVGSARNAARVHMHPDGRHFYVRHTRSNQSVLSIVDVASSSVVASLERSVGWGIAFTPDGSKAYATIPDGVAILDTETHEILQTIRTAGNPQSIAVAQIPGGCALPPDYCVGDCDRDDVVTVDELITGVSLALGSQRQSCRAFEGPERGAPTIETLIAGVNNAVGGCQSGGLASVDP